MEQVHVFIFGDSILFNILLRESLVSKIVVSGVFVVRNLVPNAFLKIVTCNEHACILMLWCLCPECVEGLKGVKDLVDVWIVMWLLQHLS